MSDEKIVDGKGMILGRVASRIAKMLIQNEHVVLLNADKVLISGHIDDILEEYKRKMDLRDKANPEHSPYWSRKPDLFVKRVIRGMLPYKKAKGKKAYKLLRVYIGIPSEYKDKKYVELDKNKSYDMFERTISVGEFSKKLGYVRE
ncbi:MAG: 50S ribosomal protein L13 [Candidatus Micrarchaeia archaeon]